MKCPNAFMYNIKRNKKLLNFFNLLPFAVMFLLIMAVSTVQNSFEDEYLNVIKKNYPTNTFIISEWELQSPEFQMFEYKDKVKIYDFYKISEHNINADADIIAYYLADKEDSVFSLKGMVEEGSFPRNDNEILVSREFIENIYGENAGLGKYIGEKVTFKGESFTISGILFSLDEKKRSPSANEEFESFLNMDIYYRKQKGNLIFIPYEKIKTMGEIFEREDKFKMASYKGLYDDMNVVGKLRNIMSDGRINQLDNDIKEAQYMVNNISRILLFIFGVCFVISCIFMSSQIRIELFYRKKELGFLQIFGLKKKRIMKLICAGYMLKVFASFAYATVAYAVIILIYSATAGHMVFLNLMHVILVIAVIMIFYIASVYLSANKFLRKSIIKLVTDT